jgi:hypothetical protein
MGPPAALTTHLGQSPEHPAAPIETSTFVRSTVAGQTFGVGTLDGVPLGALEGEVDGCSLLVGDADVRGAWVGTTGVVGVRVIILLVGGHFLLIIPFAPHFLFPLPLRPRRASASSSREATGRGRKTARTRREANLAIFIFDSKSISISRK